MNSSLLGKIDLNRIAQRYDCDESWLVGVPYSVVAARLMFAIHELVMQLGERYKGFIVRPLSMDHADTNDTDDPPTGLSGTMEPSAPWKVGEPAINIVLKEDGPHTTFVEIETDDGRSIGIGTRLFSDKDYTEYTRLRITADEIVVACRKLPPEPEHQFVTRGDFEQFRAWLSQQRTAEWTRLMEHSHDNDGTVVFPKEEE